MNTFNDSRALAMFPFAEVAKVFDITYKRISTQPPPSGLDLGHVIVRLDDREVTSENRTPNQACMIFITATQWTDEASRFLLHGRAQSLELIAADSSFRISLTRRGKERRGVLAISVAGVSLGKLPPRELADTMLRAGRTLRDEHPLPATDVAREDLDAALAEFRNSIEQLGPPSTNRKPANRRGGGKR